MTWLTRCILALLLAAGVAGADLPSPSHQPVPPETQPSPPEPPTPPQTQPAPPQTQPTPPESQPVPPQTQPAQTQPAETQPVESQPAQSQPGKTTTSAATTTTTTSTSTSRKAEKKDTWLAIINGTVHTVSGPTLMRATVLCKNDKIVSVGNELRLPLECTVIDAAGMHVYPGLVAASAGGLHGGAPVEHTTDLFSLNMELALAGGITTAIAGTDVAKLTWGTPEKMIVRKGPYVDLATAWRSPLARAELQRDLERVRSYRRDLQRFELAKAAGEEDAKEPEKDWLRGKYEQYLKLLQGELSAVISADEQPDLVALAELAREYNFRLIIRGAREAWTVPHVLARADVGVVITPRNTIEPDQRLNRPTGSSIESARILMQHGLDVAVVPPLTTIVTFGIAGRDLLQLNMEAAFAVRGGLHDEQAIRTITIDPARILGVADRVGSIEPGKDADLIVTDGHLLHYMTLVQHTVVNGRHVYDKSKSSLFAHIRPTAAQRDQVPEFDDVWPRRLEWPADLPESTPTSRPASRPTAEPASAPASATASAPASQ